MKQRRISAILSIVTIGVALGFALPNGLVKAAEGIDNLPAQGSPMEEPAKNARSFDAFTMAFMGLSLGCMLIASAVHWTRSQRHSIEDQIRDLAAFVNHNTAVTFHVAGGCSANPMVSIAKEIAQKRGAGLQACENGRTAMIDTISSVEADIMRMWG